MIEIACPLQVVTSEARTALRAAEWRAKGMLPDPGGWLDQVNSFMRLCDWIDAEKSEQEFEIRNGNADRKTEA